MRMQSSDGSRSHHHAVHQIVPLVRCMQDRHEPLADGPYALLQPVGLRLVQHLSEGEGKGWS